jgi:glutamate dehydrogenase
MRSLWSEIESLDNKVADAAQKKMISDVVGLVERGTVWLLRNRPSPLEIADTVQYFKLGVEELGNSFPRVLAASNRLAQKRRVRQLLAAGVPPPVANRIAGLVAMSSAFDIVDVATISNQPVPLVATVYYEIGDRLNLHWLRDKIAELPVRNHWHSMAKFSLRNDLHKHQRDLVAEILSASEGGRAKKRVKNWVHTSQDACGRFERLITDLRGSGTVDFAMLSVAVSEAQTLVTARSESSLTDA